MNPQSNNRLTTTRLIYQNQNSDLETLRWLFTIRWKSAFGFLLVLAASFFIPGVPFSSVFNLTLVVLLFLAFNGMYALLLRGDPPARTVEWLRRGVIPFDVVVSTLAIYISGGVLTPIFIIYSIAILMSIVLLDPKGVYRTAGLAVLLYSALTFLEAYRLVPHISGYRGKPDYYDVATSTTYGIHVIVVCSMLLMAAYMGNRISQLLKERNSLIRSQLNDLHTLYRITKGLGNFSDQDEMLNYLAERLKTLQDASLSIIAIVKPDGRVEIKAAAGASPESLLKLRQLKIDNPYFAGLLRHDEPLIIEDVSKYPEFLIYSVNPNTKSAYVYPITAEEKVIGAITLSFDKFKPLSQEYHNLMLTITAQAGVALQRAQLFSDTQRLAHEMSTLYNLGLYTGSTLSMREVLNRTSDNIERLMKPDTYYIALYEETSDTLTFETFKEYGEEMPKMRMSLAEGGLTGRIIKERKPLLVQDWHVEGQQHAGVVRKVGADMLSYLGVPMLWQDRVIGVISVQCALPMAFDAHDERLLQAFAAQTAMALENAKLHQFAQEQGRLDSLTQVYNHGYFVELVESAVAHSDKHDDQVALIMLDIDHFKLYNDTYGHVAGDNVLTLVAQALKASVRKSDSVGRWGGEEFGVLLPGAGLVEAKRVARTIRRAVAELAPSDGHGRPISSPTVSQGVAAYPFPAASGSKLIEEADAALYQAKADGRNQLVVYDTHGMLADGVLASTRTLRLG